MLLAVGGGVCIMRAPNQVQTLTDVTLSEEASGAGTVSFGPNMSSTGRGSSVGREPQPCFDSIADAREVFEQICLPRRSD